MNERKMYQARLPSASEWAKMQRDLARATRRHKDALRTVRKLREQYRAILAANMALCKERDAARLAYAELRQKYLSLPACHRHCWLRKVQP